jgi:ATP-dependent protease ClpP protease subunit
MNLWQAQESTPPTDLVGEVEIRGKFIGTPGRWEDCGKVPAPEPDEILSERTVLAEIAAQQARGVRVLLITLETGGGNAEAGLAIYNAIRCFSRGGGTVIVHAVGWVASLGPLIALAGNYVFMTAGAQLVVHSALGPAAPAAHANRLMLGVFTARTFTPPSMLEQWLSLRENDKGEPARAILDAPAALYYGWADKVATREEALVFAAALAGGLSALVGADAAELGEIEQRRSLSMAGVSMYTPQTNDGFKPQVPPALQVVQPLPGQTTASAITQDRISLAIRNNQNVFPNPTSEIDPLDGVVVLDDGTNPEFDFRHNAGTGAYAGAWVRRLIRTTAGTTKLLARFPASPGELYTFKNQHKYISTGGTPTAKTTMTYLDKDGGALSGAGSSTHPTGDTTWTATPPLTGSPGTPLTAPAATAYVEFGLELTTAASGTAEIWWDALNAFKFITGGDIMAFSITPDKLNVATAIYSSNAGQTIGHATWTTVNFEDAEEASGLVTTGASWHFSAPSDGIYQVFAIVTVDKLGVTDPTGIVVARLVKNSTEIQRGSRDHGTAAGVYGSVLSALVRCVATDQLHVDVYQDNGTSESATLEALGAANRICIIGPLDN